MQIPGITSFERRRQPLISRRRFADRMLKAVGLWCILAVVGLAIGMAGYAAFEGMSLAELIVQEKFLAVERATNIFLQVSNALAHAHNKGVIHRDLKPENILLDSQMHTKITDFGTAKILKLPGKPDETQNSIPSLESNERTEGGRASSFVGTAEYVSPELLTDKNACKASDLWAFGCIIFQLLAGRLERSESWKH